MVWNDDEKKREIADEGWIIDTGAGYIAIRKADGKSAHFPPYIGAFENVRAFLKNKEE